MTTLAFVFALPEESRDFVRSLRDRVRTGPVRRPDIRGMLGSQPVRVFHTGMGAERAGEGMRRLMDGAPEIGCVISAGYAGGLDPGLPVGALLLGANRSDAEPLAAAQAALAGRCRIVPMADSLVTVESVMAKAALARETGAAAVDMETATVARICRERGVPVLSVRVVSDEACTELPVPFSVCFDPVSERPLPGKLIAFLLRRPSRIPAFARFVAGIDRSRRILTGALLEVAAELGQRAESARATIESV